jgi:hypothetical protein
VTGNLDRHVLEHEACTVADRRLVDRDLVVGVTVHEDVVAAVVVKVRHVASVDGGSLDLDAGVEGLVDDLARQHVLQLGSHESGALARLDVLELDNRPQLALDLQDQAVLEITSGSHLLRVSSIRSKPSTRQSGLWW